MRGRQARLSGLTLIFVEYSIDFLDRSKGQIWSRIAHERGENGGTITIEPEDCDQFIKEAVMNMISQNQ
jgi:hypothetical protein